MPALFFLSASNAESSPVQEIVSRLSRSYEDIVPLPSWSIYHRLFRETPAIRGSQQSSPVRENSERPKSRYLQVLSLSYDALRTYVAITAVSTPHQMRAGTPATPTPNPEYASGDPATIVSIPSGASSDEFVQLILTKFGPLWQQRQVLHVSNGMAFEVGGFRIRIGELKQGYGGGTTLSRGAICGIEVVESEGQDAEKEMESNQALIRGFWEGFDIKGAREVYDVPGMVEGDIAVRQWCELLRLRI